MTDHPGHFFVWGFVKARCGDIHTDTVSAPCIFSKPGPSTEAETLTTEAQDTAGPEQDEVKRLIAEQFEEQKRFIAEQFAEQKRFIAEQFEIKINSKPSINIS